MTAAPISVSVETQRAAEELLHRYATAADSRDWALLATCFSTAIDADYGPPIGSFTARDDLVARLQGLLSTFGPTLHFISNVVARPDGDGLSVRSYTHAVLRIQGAEAPVRTAGIYEDYCVQESDGWKIARRRYIPVG